jgi:hypothetical protein
VVPKVGNVSTVDSGKAFSIASTGEAMNRGRQGYELGGEQQAGAAVQSKWVRWYRATRKAGWRVGVVLGRAGWCNIRRGGDSRGGEAAGR